MSILISILVVLFCHLILKEVAIFSILMGLVAYTVVATFVEIVKLSFLQRKLPWKHSTIALIFLTLQMTLFKVFIWVVISFTFLYGLKVFNEMQGNGNMPTIQAPQFTGGTAVGNANPKMQVLRPINRAETASDAQKAQELPPTKITMEKVMVAINTHQTLCINMSITFAGIVAISLLRFLYSGFFWGICPLNGYQYSISIEKIQGKNAQGILRVSPSAGLWNTGLLNRIIVNLQWRHKVFVKVEDFEGIQPNTAVDFEVSKNGIITSTLIS